ncbi:hypothetical protein FACS1894218_5500 [Bacilli bacterium]|nr:hypothetical protein FACS1894218_5500 [Bacilli bacterium]
METTNLSRKASGMAIPLNLSNQGKYEFKLISITSDTVNQDDSFIYSTESNIIANQDANVSNINNIYTLSEEQIIKVNFNNNNPGYNQNYYPSQMTDEVLFNTYVNLITNYGETADFNILNKDQYHIIRNEVVGTINLNIIIDGNVFENEYSGFKVMGQKIPDIDGSLDKFNITGVDLSNGQIIKLLELNHFNSYVANSLDYDVVNDDNVNGVATISVIGCDDHAIHDIYINQTFKINKLQPYFIQQAKDIDKSLYKISPSKITLDQFKNYFIKMSPEFQNRNLEDLQIDLIPSTNALVGKISYTEGTNGEVTNLVYTYGDFAEHSTYTFII